jgi:hypothetical protein
MDRRAFLVASAIAGAAIAGVLVGLDDGPRVAIASLPKAMSRPDCTAGRVAGTYHVDYAAGSGFPTPTAALASALAIEHNGSSVADFRGRAVRAEGRLAYEFIQRWPDGSLKEVASATQVEGERWLVSVTHRCFFANH